MKKEDLLPDAESPARARGKRVYLRKTEAVLDAAEQLFLQQGFVATSMQDVAATAGVAKATIYSNFPNKESLFEAVIHRRAEKSQQQTQSRSTDLGDVEGTLVNLACAFLMDIYSREQIELFQTVVSDARRFPLLGRKMIEGPFVQTHGRIVGFFQEWAQTGDLHCADPNLAAEYFISLIKATKHIPLVFNQPVDIRPKELRRIASGAVDIFLHGIRRGRASPVRKARRA